jgi:hypothetical protein
MRTSTLQVVDYSDLFKSAKCAVAIPVRHLLIGEALVQASLDPRILSINYIPTVTVGASLVALDAAVLVQKEGRRILDVVDAPPVVGISGDSLRRLALKQLGLTPLTLSASDIRREPLYSNARLVWSYRNRKVPIGLRIRVLELLAEDGPIRLANLLAATGSNEVDPAAGVLALACANLLEIELSETPFGPQTLVRCRN